MDEIQQDDFKGDLAHPEELSGQSKLAPAQRQWIQICAAKGTFNSTYLDKQGLQEEILQFTFEGIPQALEQPEFADPERLKALLQLIARHEQFEQTLDAFVGREVGEVRTAIGQENPLSELHPFTLMATRYELDGRTGFLGVLGPRRMRYARTLALIHGIAGYLDRLS